MVGHIVNVNGAHISSSGSSEFQLDVVGVAEGQDADAEGFAQVFDFAVGNAVLVEDADGVVQGLPRTDIEAQMVETKSVFVEPVVGQSLGGVGRRSHGHDGGAVAKDSSFGAEFDGDLESEQAGIKFDGAFQVANGQG